LDLVLEERSFERSLSFFEERKRAGKATEIQPILFRLTLLAAILEKKGME
jgi:hypothetical protein